MAANLVYVEVLTCGEDALEPCLMLSIERRAAYSQSTKVLSRYFFSAPEEIVRFCGSHQIKLGQLSAVFATCPNSAAGLPELFLAARELGLAKLVLRGCSGLQAFAQAVWETLAGRGGLALDVEDAAADALMPCYEDEHLKVWAFAIRTSSGHLPPSNCIGFRCEPVQASRGAAVLVLPPGAPALKDLLFSSLPLGAGAGGAFAVHLGPLPSGAGKKEFSITDSGRRRGLWKSSDRLCRFRALCPQLLPALRPRPPSCQPEAVLRAYLEPEFRLEPGREEVNSDQALMAEALSDADTWNLSQQLQGLSAKLAKLSAHEAELELLFLGTGSAKPTSRRGQSGILLRLGKFSALIDCGGGTWGQLCRLLGTDQAQQVVDDLQLVWISHHHADHCAGLPAVLRRRRKTGLRVVAPQRVSRYWQAASHFLKETHVSAEVVSPEKFQAPSEDGWPLLRSILVPHCAQSFGLILRTDPLPSKICSPSNEERRGVQVVYSGDCRPSPALVSAARQNATALDTWLIHEATFDALEQDQATARRHSTIDEALSVAGWMHAKGVLLTHFSQRYPSIGGGASDGNSQDRDGRATVDPGSSEWPRQPTSNPEFWPGAPPPPPPAAWRPADTAAGAAFDGLHIRASQLEGFAAARPVLEEFWARRFQRTEELRRTQPQEPRQPLAGALFPGRTFAAAASAAAAAAAAQTPTFEGSCHGRMEVEDATATRAASEEEQAPRHLIDRLREFYRRLNPEKVGDALSLALRFDSKEDALNSKLRGRYDGEDLETQGLGLPASNRQRSDDESEAETLPGAKRQRSRTFLLPPPPPPPRRCVVADRAPNDSSHDSSEFIATPPWREALTDEKRQRSNLEAVKDENRPPRSLQTGPAESARTEAMLSVMRLEAQLHAFYERHNPAKVPDAAKVARLFAGKEDDLNEKLRRQYAGKDLSCAFQDADL